MNNMLIICGADEIGNYCQSGVTHIICIRNPRAANIPPEWFTGEYLQLNFGDVNSESDAKAYNSRAPNTEDILTALEFSRKAWADEAAIILVSCNYGASRSPALAYVLWADKIGQGNEKDALAHILDIRPQAVPNNYVVELGDSLLGRNGELIAALKDFNDELTTMIEKNFKFNH